MMRIVVENLLLFLLPTLIYVAYIYLTRAEKPDGRAMLDEAPLLWLFAIGAGLVVVTLMVFGSTSGGKPGEVYQPPVLRDGKIVPGHIGADDKVAR